VRLDLHQHTDSTNAVAAARAREGAEDGLLVVAEHQEAGRGRLDRSWETPAGAGLTFSLLLRPTLDSAAWPWLPLLTGLAVTETLVELGWQATVKWPNDVLLGDRKVAGVLVERVETTTGPAAILGVGINVTTTAEELPVPTATSLLLADPEQALDRSRLLVRAIATLRRRYDAWADGGETEAAAVAAAYVDRCATLGQQVRVDLPGGGTLHGEAVDVDRSGMLVVRTEAGSERVGAGDVVHVRTAPPGQVG
jgi:BirA family biotin operon repressor/biotin-[acetyl-CoA-carboxylase] ligase